jgi:CheY-like chemotaxis protein
VLVVEDDVERQNWFLKRFFGQTVDLASTAAQGIRLLTENRYDGVFLDYDLTPEHSAGQWDDSTGYAVACHLAQNPQRRAIICVHSMNPSGSQRMVDALRSAGVHVEHLPFPQLKRSRISFS